MSDTENRSLPPGYCWQIAKEDFDFDIVTRSTGFQKYKKHAEKQGLVRDICDPSLSDETLEVPVENYINVAQKSAQWFKLRKAAGGTASSVGKMIKGPLSYPTTEQINDKWLDKITNAPFVVTHTMRGHMKWGVGYEDPALIHFAVDNNLSVVQVGTIYTPLSYIISLIPEYFNDTEQKTLQSLIQCLTVGDAHLIVSPDGLVGTPDGGAYTDIPSELVGMLEIKCISPFHHIEEKNSSLSWVDNMETRQWYTAREIPFVYVIQICLQAISGLYHLDMTSENTMWFMRWSPSGFSEFSMPFEYIVRIGIMASLLYFSLIQRIKAETDLPFQYNAIEMPVSTLLNKYYFDLVDSKMSHRYVELDKLYPEFFTYQKYTERFRFKVKGDSTGSS